jgi:hypothetical protein
MILDDGIGRYFGMGACTARSRAKLLAELIDMKGEARGIIQWTKPNQYQCVMVAVRRKSAYFCGCGTPGKDRNAKRFILRFGRDTGNDVDCSP